MIKVRHQLCALKHNTKMQYRTVYRHIENTNSDIGDDGNVCVPVCVHYGTLCCDPHVVLNPSVLHIHNFVYQSHRFVYQIYQLIPYICHLVLQIQTEDFILTSYCSPLQEMITVRSGVPVRRRACL